MGNEIIIAILVVVMFFALRSSMKHFRGEGGCCGGGSPVKPEKKKLKGDIVCRMSVTIEGMRCENCANRVMGRVNELDGVACKVDLKKKKALITALRQVDEKEIREKITGLGYAVTNIVRQESW